MKVNRQLTVLQRQGVSIWIDALGRDELEGGTFEHRVRRMCVTGVTSNPSTFAAALRSSDLYDRQIAALTGGQGVRDTRELFWALALADIQSAADMLADVHERTAGQDGYVSFECTPDVAHDTLATVQQATDLHARIDRPNAMIKVPGTAAGVDAIKLLTAAGISVNVTLLFSLNRYATCLDAYLSGLELRLGRGLPLSPVASVASLFLSRVDAKVDAVLPESSDVLGEVALATAAQVVDHYRGHLQSPRWRRLAAAGARPQRPLWASVAPKADRYRDVRYVERLVVPDTVVTMPPATLEAFADHGDADSIVEVDAHAAATTLAKAAELDVDLSVVEARLEREGLASFADAYAEIIDRLGRELSARRPNRVRACGSSPSA